MPTFGHEACFYDGPEDFVGAVAPFVRDGIEVDDDVLVVVDREKIGLLRDALGDDARHVTFADMGAVGHNPARIIPAWVDFVGAARALDRRPRGVGEPIGASRSASELRECHLHEGLLNHVFAGEDWRLLCPYDTATLAPAVIEEARRTHPLIDTTPSSDFRLPPAGEWLVGDLPEPLDVELDMTFDRSTLSAVRNAIRAAAEHAGLGPRAGDAVLAVNELASNSVQHGGGTGRVRSWRDGRTLVAEVADRGVVHDPLVGRLQPPQHQVGGRGLWLCNQLCDLVQIRSTAAGTTVRLHLAAGGPAPQLSS